MDDAAKSSVLWTLADEWIHFSVYASKVVFLPVSLFIFHFFMLLFCLDSLCVPLSLSLFLWHTRQRDAVY